MLVLGNCADVWMLLLFLWSAEAITHADCRLTFLKEVRTGTKWHQLDCFYMQSCSSVREWKSPRKGNAIIQFVFNPMGFNLLYMLQCTRVTNDTQRDNSVAKVLFDLLFTWKMTNDLIQRIKQWQQKSFERFSVKENERSRTKGQHSLHHLCCLSKRRVCLASNAASHLHYCHFI